MWSWESTKEEVVVPVCESVHKDEFGVYTLKATGVIFALAYWLGSMHFAFCRCSVEKEKKDRNSEKEDMSEGMNMVEVKSIKL